jgi:hypothetical protein
MKYIDWSGGQKINFITVENAIFGSMPFVTASSWRKTKGKRNPQRTENALRELLVL